jgi:hypothetical protein
LFAMLSVIDPQLILYGSLFLFRLTKQET